MKAVNYDIQVNDWVLNKTECAVKVVGRMGDGILLECERYPIYDEFEPILITPEILIKNKFDVIEYSKDFIEFISEDKRIILNELSNSIEKDWNCHIDNDKFKTIGSADIQYIHELQHLLRLCGIDKEIEL